MFSFSLFFSASFQLSTMPQLLDRHFINRPGHEVQTVSSFVSLYKCANAVYRSVKVRDVAVEKQVSRNQRRRSHVSPALLGKMHANTKTVRPENNNELNNRTATIQGYNS